LIACVIANVMLSDGLSSIIEMGPACNDRPGVLAEGQHSKKRERLNYFKRRVAELRRAREWQPLKRIRNKRRRVAEYYRKHGKKAHDLWSWDELPLMPQEYENGFQDVSLVKLQRTIHA